eukprot:289251-Karenia_brevis.AAC.1
MAPEPLKTGPKFKKIHEKIDANIDENFVCILSSLLFAYRANMASKRPPTSEGGPRLHVFGAWTAFGALLRALGAQDPNLIDV